VKLLVGLGNPGTRYAPTRHNVGFRIVERWARRRAVPLEAERFGGCFGRAPVSLDGVHLDVAVLEPLTYMNRSGASVAQAVRELPVEDPASDLLVVFDDVDLPFGRLRLRPGGGAGGHRGLSDVIAALGSSDLPRLRFGVGRPGGMDTAEWVLLPFGENEESRLGAHLDRAADAVDSVLLEGIRAAMNRFNSVTVEPT
jgi:PTH1 family peptidyl-tRNA hydrolase